MRIYNPIIAVFAVGCAVVASPLAPVPHTMILAGIVVTDKGVAYQMQHLEEIKTFDAKVDNGEYPYPVTYQVAAGYSCVFYLESTRGVGSAIGQFDGPTTGGFNDKIGCYKCWVAKACEELLTTDGVSSSAKEVGEANDKFSDKIPLTYQC